MIKKTKKLYLYENNKYLQTFIKDKNTAQYLRLPNNKIVLGHKKLLSPDKQYTPIEFWDMYSYISFLISFNVSYLNRCVTLSKYQLLYELGYSKSRLEQRLIDKSGEYYLNLIYSVLEYMSKGDIISYLPENLKELSLHQSFQFVLNNDYTYPDFKIQTHYSKLYPFEFYSVFSNNNYSAKTRLELLNLYLCIKAYGRQSKEHFDVCYKSKRSLSNLTGLPQRIVDARYKTLIELNLISSHLLCSEKDKNILLTVPSDTSKKHVNDQIDKFIASYGFKNRAEHISVRKNIPFVDNRKKRKDKSDLEMEYDGKKHSLEEYKMRLDAEEEFRQTMEMRLMAKHCAEGSDEFITPEEILADRRYAEEQLSKIDEIDEVLT